MNVKQELDLNLSLTDLSKYAEEIKNEFRNNTSDLSELRLQKLDAKLRQLTLEIEQIKDMAYNARVSVEAL